MTSVWDAGGLWIQLGASRDGADWHHSQVTTLVEQRAEPMRTDCGIGFEYRAVVAYVRRGLDERRGSKCARCVSAVAR
jgi:hypothetical protein